MTRIPAHLGELNDEWLTDAMRDGGHIDGSTAVASHTSSRIGEGAGFLGDLARVELTYEGSADGAPTSMIAKFPTEKPENRGFGMILGAYENEIRFYAELADQMQVPVPDCYFGALDPEPRSSAIVGKVMGWLPGSITLRMLDRLTLAAGNSDRRFGLLIEDLGERRVGDQAGGCGLAEAELALRALASMHATFWESPVLDRPWVNRADDTPGLVHGLFQRAWPIYEARFEKLLTPEVRARSDWVAEHGPQLLKRMGQPPLTLTHGDYRLDNLMFHDPGTGSEEVTMIDFQGVTASNPMPDVAYFLLPNVRAEVAAEHEEALLRVYHDALVAGGVTNYSWERCREDYTLAQLWLVHRGVILIGSLDLSHERGVELVDHAVERSLPKVNTIDLAAIRL
jgi:hypothetical protein